MTDGAPDSGSGYAGIGRGLNRRAAECVDEMVGGLAADGTAASIHFQGGRYSGKSAIADIATGSVWRAGGLVARINVDAQIDLLPRACLAVEDLLGELDAIESVRPALEAIDLEHLRMSTEPIRIVHPRIVVPSDAFGAARDVALLLGAVGRTAQRIGTFVVIIIDDVHRVDRPGGRALFEAIELLRGARLPVAFVLLGLPGLPRLTRGAVSPDVTAIPIPALGRADVVEQVSAVCGATATTAAADWIDGSRLRASTLLQVLRVSGSDVSTPAGISRAIRRADAVINRSVYEPAIEALNERERRLLRSMLAAGGDTFDWERLDRLAAASADVSLRAVLPRLLEKELVLQDAAYHEFSLALPQWDEYLRRRFDADEKVGLHYV